MSSNTNKVKVITHDRVVHADDAFATAILQIVYNQVVIVRTRDPVTVRANAGAPGVYLLDIGGRYDPGQRLFDHHQPEGAGYRNPVLREWPYATAGLVWKAYGAKAIKKLHPSLPDEGVDELVTYVDDVLLKFIDAVDCGVKLKGAGPSVSSVIASFNPAWFEPEKGEHVFPLVVSLCEVILTNFINRHAGKVLARDKVSQSDVLLDGRVLLLEACIPWSEVVATRFPEVLLTAYPVKQDDGSVQWQLRAASNLDGTSRISFPPAWGGLDRQMLTNACGIENVVFCHRSGHLAGAETFESILAMARATLAHACVTNESLLAA